MTIKEMFKKIETYNEVAEMVRTEKLKVEVTVDSFFGDSFNDFNSFKKYIKANWIKEAVDAMLKCSELEFDTEYELKYNGRFGEEMTMKIEVGAYAA